MCRAERMCKRSVYMKTEAAYVPPFPFIEPEVHTHFCQPVSTARYKEKEEGFPKGGTLVHLFGSVPKARLG